VSTNTPVSLAVPQGNAFAVLGHSCGGIQEQAYATGWGPNSFPQGDVQLQTRCGGSGRGGGYHVTTYTAWVSATWDLTATFISDTPLSGAPAFDPTYSSFDPNGNEIYNSSTRAYLLLANGFVPPPRVTGISVATGPATGGTNVTISGDGLTNASAVDFGSVGATFTVVSDTSITAVSPAASAGTADVTVKSAGGASAASSVDQFTFVAAPTITGLSPNSGPVAGGNEVTITGTNLSTTTGVMFGDAAAGFVVNSDTSITAYAPNGENPDTKSVHVKTIGGTSPSTPADVYTYV